MIDGVPSHYPRTPDGRYFVADRKLWRLGDPSIAQADRERLQSEVSAAKKRMNARGAVDRVGARKALFAARQALGEIGPVWWTDDAPDYSRKLVAASPYAHWYAALVRKAVTGG